MTIAAGILCSDGVVLGADTEFTGPIKHSGSKIWGVVPNGLRVRCLMAGAGDVILLRSMRDKLAAAPAFDKAKNREETVACIEDQMAGLFQRHVFPNPTYTDRNQALSLVFGLRDSEGCGLYETSGTAVAKSERYACIGYGSDLGSYLLETLLESEPAILNGIATMIYVLKQAKKYSLYCGGDSHLFVLRKNGEVSCVDPQRTVAIERLYASSSASSTRLALLRGARQLELARNGFGAVILKAEETQTKASRAPRPTKRDQKVRPPSPE
jgi:20S proteasome alpha/beta subunit